MWVNRTPRMKCLACVCHSVVQGLLVTRPCQQAARSLTAAARAAVVFGRVVEGMKLVRKLETMGTQSGKPRTARRHHGLRRGELRAFLLPHLLSQPHFQQGRSAHPAPGQACSSALLGSEVMSALNSSSKDCPPCGTVVPDAPPTSLPVLGCCFATNGFPSRPPAAAPILPDCHTHPFARPSPMSAPILHHTARPAQLSGRGSPFTAKLWPWTDTSSFSRLTLVPVPAAAPQSAPDPGKTRGRETDAGGPQEEPCSCGP